jgi:hypothetical protein
MIRSILPSTARKGARHDLAAIKRKSRRTVRQDLHAVVVDPEVWEERSGFNDYPYEDIAYAVSDRRGADNVAALQRWAPSQVKGVRPEDALSKMRGLLPDSTVGRHALTHIDHLEAFYVPEDHMPARVYDGKSGYGIYRAHLERTGVTYGERLRAILEQPGKHKALNRLLKPDLYKIRREWGATRYKYVNVSYPETGRPLYGYHDVGACVAYYLTDHERKKKFTTALDKIEGGK